MSKDKKQDSKRRKYSAIEEGKIEERLYLYRRDRLVFFLESIGFNDKTSRVGDVFAHCLPFLSDFFLLGGLIKTARSKQKLMGRFNE